MIAPSLEFVGEGRDLEQLNVGFLSVVEYPEWLSKSDSDGSKGHGEDVLHYQVGCFPLMDSNNNSLSLMHLAMAHASHLAFVIQGEFGDLDIKYLKKNISKCRSHISGSFKRTPRHCAKWLRNSRGKRYQRIRICLTREVETPSFPIRRQAPDVKYPEKVKRRLDRIPDVGYPEKIERRKGDRLRVHGVRTPPPDDTERTSLSGATPSGSPRGHVTRSPIRTLSGRSTRHSQSSHPDDSISYPDMLSGSLTKVHKPCYVIPTACHSPRSTALRWCVRICLW
ncbi:hypothetical protein CK203_076964 [Vitis vinifera]|uniref:Uncharacterized protein n=1 Tax=Vitis vinifera TaxID=29760 RepID=A0A438DZI6_VITVI|nr:hypothetical protein CK203_076964 [Vitis vinifera]